MNFQHFFCDFKTFFVIFINIRAIIGVRKGADYMTNLQIALVRYREKNHITQIELAETLGCSRDALANWETGRAIPRPNILTKISNLIGVNTDYLLGIPASPPSAKEQLKGVQLALFNQVGELTEEQAEDVLQFINFIKSKGEK